MPRLMACSHSRDDPASRFRVVQYLPHVAAAGWEVTHRPNVPSRYWRPRLPLRWLRSIERRTAVGLRRWNRRRDIRDAADCDVVFLNRDLQEGAAVWERRLFAANPRVVFDFDDAIHLGAEKRAHIGWVCRQAAWVTPGNETLAAFAREFTDRVTVIRDGEYVNGDDVSKVTKDQLVSWMVGRSLSNLYPKENLEIGDVIFEARGIRQEGVLDGIDLTLRRGEILGLSGLAGAGRTELALALCGLVRIDSGEILIDGRSVRIRDYRAAMAQGIVYISEDRQKYGLVIPMSVTENITFPLLSRISGAAGIIDAAREREISGTYIGSLAIKTPGGDAVVNNLSGGNQQKVSVAKALATEPRILILDEPTRGVDVGAKSEIHRIISNLAREGKAIIMISSDLPEILGMSDRVLVMKGGKKRGELSRAELSQERILQMAL